jgi:hypothetical protein
MTSLNHFIWLYLVKTCRNHRFPEMIPNLRHHFGNPNVRHLKGNPNHKSFPILDILQQKTVDISLPTESPRSRGASSVTKSARRSSDMGLGAMPMATEMGQGTQRRLVIFSINPSILGVHFGTYPFLQNFLMFFNASLQAANRPTPLTIKICQTDSTHQST